VILSAAVLVAPGWSAVSAQEVSRLNQTMDNRSNLQSEQTVGGLTFAPDVHGRQPPLRRPSRRRRPVRASKSPPRLPGPAPTKRGAENPRALQVR
jgi:hypothetical protein